MRCRSNAYMGLNEPDVPDLECLLLVSNCLFDAEEVTLFYLLLVRYLLRVLLYLRLRLQSWPS